MADAPKLSLDEIDAFLAVARAGSFVAAAREGRTPVSTLSRRVAALERRLGVQLLKRSTRALALTDDGRGFADRCSAAMAEIAAASNALCDRATTLRGPLRVTAPQYACNQEFGPMLLDFAARHPELELDLRLTNGTPDMIEDKIDLAFHLTPLPESTHVARRLWTIRYALCASPAFISRRNRTLRHPRDLASEPCVITAPITTWHFEHPAQGQAAVSPRTLGARVDDLGLGARCAIGIGLRLSSARADRGGIRPGAAGDHLRRVAGAAPGALRALSSVQAAFAQGARTDRLCSGSPSGSRVRS